MYESSDFPRCKTLEEANITVVNLLKAFNEYRLNEMGCLVPCFKTVYDFEFTLYHENSDLVIVDENKKEEKENDLIVSTFYRTFNVEENIETVVYDIVNLLAAAGGNLGLLLGFSCLSALLHLHEIFVKRFLSD